MAYANDQLCSSLPSSVLRALHQPPVAPKSEFLAKLGKLDQKIDNYEHKMQQKQEIYQDLKQQEYNRK